MDPDMYNAAMEGDFSLVDHRVENGYQVTPNGNTILHVAALFGQQDFVEEVLKITPTLLCYKNNKNETVLHIAANVGQIEVVEKLLSIEGKETLVRMTDDIGDTALHKAVRSGHVDIVRSLMDLLLNSEHDFPANKARETPLYLAAESGFHDVLIEILNVYVEPTYVAGPFNRTPLHAAVIQKHTRCARFLWQRNKPLCEETDERGWNSLHYAVKQGLTGIVSDMLGWKKSLAYIRAGSENDWTTAFHIAISEGHKSMIHELLFHCPDCWDMVNSNGQNVLHVAILLNDEDNEAVNALFKLSICDGLVDEADNEGNTPLHLLAASGNHVPPSKLHHPTAKNMACAKIIMDNYYWRKLLVLAEQNSTLLDQGSSWIPALKKTKGEEDSIKEDVLPSSGQQRDDDGLRRALPPQLRKTPRIPLVSGLHFINNARSGQRCEFEVRKDDHEGKAKRAKFKIEKILKSTEIQVVVATLIMTVTFAAGFTLPGGLDSDDGPNRGMAILIKKTAFCAFVISDVLAFACAATAIFIYFTMADRNVDHDEEIKRDDRFNVFQENYYIACVFQLLAMYAVVVAFVTGMFATLEHSLALAVTVCVIACSVFSRIIASLSTSGFIRI